MRDLYRALYNALFVFLAINTLANLHGKNETGYWTEKFRS